MNHRATLGVSNTAGADEIKKAYRKLAMQHHPDRNAGDPNATARFQQIQNAYAELEKTGFAPFMQPRQGPPPQPQRGQWSKPESPSGTWRDRNETIDDILDELKRAGRGAGPRYPGADPMQRDGDEIVANVSMRDAFAGFNVQVSRRRANGMIDHVYVNIPAGTPDGHRGKYRLSDNSTQTIITKIIPSDFKLRGLSDGDNLFSAGLLVGDIEAEKEVDAIDLITGNWIKVHDFLGEELTIRIPAGFNPLQRLKVANKGYYGWLEQNQTVTKQRMDMYVRLRPVYNKPADIDRQKIINLYNTLGERDASN